MGIWENDQYFVWQKAVSDKMQELKADRPRLTDDEAYLLARDSLLEDWRYRRSLNKPGQPGNPVNDSAT